MRRQQRGFTLIEVMVALALFSFAIVAAMSVAVSMTQGFREQRQFVAAESAVRRPMDFVAEALRNASPAAPTGNVQDVATCTTSAITVNDSTTAPDSIDIVYAVGAMVTSLRSTYDNSTNGSIVVNDGSAISNGDTLLISNTDQGHLVVVSNVSGNTISLTAPGCGITLPADGYPPGSLVIRAQRARFYVDLTGSLTEGLPALMMDPDAGGAGAPEPLVEGIEDMQVALGVDVNGNGAIDANEWAYSAGVGALVGPIRAVRVTIVARAQNQLVGGLPAFFRPAAENRPIATAPDSYRRRSLTSTIEIRNFGGSP